MFTHAPKPVREVAAGRRPPGKTARALDHSPAFFPFFLAPPVPVQRACAACEAESRKDDREGRPPQDEEQAFAVARKAETSAGAPVGPPPAGAAATTPLVPAGGRPLAASERAPFERAFAADFRSVRVHDGPAADVAARSVDALAFTAGSDVVFRAGQFAPGTRAGERLLAHELTHVLQQRQHRPSVSAAGATPAVSSPLDASEREADRAADAFARGLSIEPPAAAPTGIARAPLPSVPTDFEVHGPGTQAALPTGAPLRVFFDLNTDTVSPADPAITGTALPATDDIQLLGYASADEIAADPTIVDRRLNNVRFHLVLAGHDPGHITMTPRPSPDRIDYRRMRSVEIVRPGESSVEPVVGAPRTQPCDPAIETAFQEAKRHAVDDFLTPVITALAAPITVGSTLDNALTTFFHGRANASTVAGNLGLIKSEVIHLSGAANHQCGTMNDSSCAGGAMAYNQPSLRRMTICPGYVPISGVVSAALADDHARNLIHEAAHSTAGLAGAPPGSSGGTSDFGYRFQRMLRHLTLSHELANSDSYALFVLTVQGGIISATPPQDTAGAGFSLPADQAAFDRAEIPLARVENWLLRAQQWIAQTHGEVREIMALPAGDPARSWSGRFSDGATFARQSGFDVARPPALPGPDDDVKYAAISDRLRALARMLRDPVEISRDTSAGARMHFTAGTPLRLSVNPVFLRNGPLVRANMMLERLFDIVPTTEISAPLRAGYAELVRRVRAAEGL